MKYFKYLWMILIIFTISIRSCGYEPSYIKREIVVESTRNEIKSSISVTMVYDPVDEIYYDLKGFNGLSIEQFKHFSGIGEVTASSIVEYIQKSGGLQSFYELTVIKGIGEKKLERILENSK